MADKTAAPALVSASLPAPAPIGPARNADGFSIQAIHLVRTTTAANLTLSQMADQKASILMGATFLVFTISVGQAGHGPVPLPLLILASFAFISACLAVAAIMPSIRPVKVPVEHQNILFFGNFTQMSEAEFLDQVIPRLRADETVFRTMLRDIYQNGQVLQKKKYKYLGLAYLSFLTGLSLTFVLFLIEKIGLIGLVLSGH